MHTESANITLILIHSSIEVNFLSLDMGVDLGLLERIQEQVFGLLETYVAAGKNDITGDIDNEAIVKRCQELLVEYGNYVEYLRLKYGLPEADHTVFLSRLAYLKERVRQVQLHIKQSEQQLLHRARIQKFESEKEAARQRKLAENGLESSREALFGLRKENGDLEANKQTIEHQILAHNKKITTSLQSTRQLMSSSIVQTELNLESLDQQTKDLSKLNEQLFTVSDILNKSGQIVKFIEKQDRKDKRRIYYSIFFFASCCAWVIWKRILKTPVRILLWSTFKMLRLANWAISSKEITNELSDSAVVAATAIVSSMTLVSMISSSITELQVTPSIEILESADKSHEEPSTSTSIEVFTEIALSEDPIIDSFSESNYIVDEEPVHEETQPHVEKKFDHIPTDEHSQDSNDFAYYLEEIVHSVMDPISKENISNELPSEDINDEPVIEEEIVNQSISYGIDSKLEAVADKDSPNEPEQFLEPDVEEYESVQEIIPEPAEEAIPEPAEEAIPEPAEEIVAEPAEEVIPEPAEEAIPEPAEEIVAEPAEEVISEPAEEIIPEPAEEAIPEPAEEAIPEPAEEIVAEPAEEIIAEPAEEVIPEPAEEVRAEPAEEEQSIPDAPSETNVELIEREPAIEAKIIDDEIVKNEDSVEYESNSGPVVEEQIMDERIVQAHINNDELVYQESNFEKEEIQEERLHDQVDYSVEQMQQDNEFEKSEDSIVDQFSSEPEFKVSSVYEPPVQENLTEESIDPVVEEPVIEIIDVGVRDQRTAEEQIIEDNLYEQPVPEQVDDSPLQKQEVVHEEIMKEPVSEEHIVEPISEVPSLKHMDNVPIAEEHKSLVDEGTENAESEKYVEPQLESEVFEVSAAEDDPNEYYTWSSSERGIVHDEL